jgi:hypothetical protein
MLGACARARWETGAQVRSKHCSSGYFLSYSAGSTVLIKFIINTQVRTFSEVENASKELSRFQLQVNTFCPFEKIKMLGHTRLFLVLWLVSRLVYGAVRVQLNDGQIVTVDDEKSINPTVDSLPGDPIGGGLSLRALFGRQSCSASGQNIICGDGCCRNDQLCCAQTSCGDPTTRECCLNGVQCPKGGDCCTDGKCVSVTRCSGW